MRNRGISAIKMQLFLSFQHIHIGIHNSQAKIAGIIRYISVKITIIRGYYSRYTVYNRFPYVPTLCYPEYPCATYP